MRQLYKPLGIVVSAGGGLVANAIFTRVWRRLAHEDHPPAATARGSGWAEVLAAAALQGAIFGLVTAAVNRASASGFRAVTGTWPEE